MSKMLIRTLLLSVLVIGGASLARFAITGPDLLGLSPTQSTLQRGLADQSGAVFTEIPTETITPDAVYIILTPEPTPTLASTLAPTPTPAPYEGLVVAAEEPVPNGPYFNMLWSPDGTKALVTKSYSEYTLVDNQETGAKTATNLTDLWLLDVPTNQETLLLDKVGRYAWSPDSMQVAYVNPTESQGVAGLLSIYDLKSGTSKELVTADFFGQDYAPQWLPDGRLIYVRDSLIWSIHSDGSNEQALASFKFAGIPREDPRNPLHWENPTNLIGFRFSPDGKQIAYKTHHESMSILAFQLWVSDADGTNPQLITGQAEGSYFEWSPNSEWLVFNTYRDVDDPTLDEHLPMTRGLWVFSTKSANRFFLHRLDNWGVILEPIWAFDSSKIAFVQLEYEQEQQQTAIWVTTIDSNPQIGPLVGAKGDDNLIGLVGWSPDLSSLFTTRTPQHIELPNSGQFSQRLVLEQK
ncbi:MAG: PD40 domain-containing protein [Caldilineaceae bacterium]|nr:PD40 domain-containing protein [Caldilineaceae bacterium]